VKTAVDTNALLALLYDDAHADASEAALREGYRNGKLVISPIVYAELAADGQFETTNELARFLTDFSIDVDPPSRRARFLAGETFSEYTDRRPDGVQCPSCGTEQTIRCEDCNDELTPRQHIAADFLIGGHALADTDALVTFDEGFFTTYFPSLTTTPTE
jgi:hypothetical protein